MTNSQIYTTKMQFFKKFTKTSYMILGLLGLVGNWKLNKFTLPT